MAAAAEEALVKIRAVLPEEEQQKAQTVRVHALQMPELDPETRARLDRVERMIEDRTRIDIRYEDTEGGATNRVIRPLGLWFWGKVWTLVAWCELRDDFRMFRVDRIRIEDELDRFRDEYGKRLADFYEQEKRRRPSLG